MKKHTFITSLIIIIIISCNSYKKLLSNHFKDEWSAEFEHYNGNEKLKFPKQNNTLLYLASKLKTDNGELFLKNGSNEILNQTPVNHTKINLNENVEIQIIGKNASGGFKLYYPKYQKKEVLVKYNPNFELLALCYLLDSYNDLLAIPDNQTFNIDGVEVRIKDLYAMNFKIAKEFKKFSNSENLRVILSYFKKDFYLHYSNFILSLQPFPYAKVNNDNAFINKFDNIEDANKFVSALNKFHIEISFDTFLEKHKMYYNTMEKEVKQNIPKENFIVEMERFFKKKVDNYILYPSLTMLFGQAFAVGSNNTIGNVFACFGKPKEINNTSKLNLGFNNSSSIRNICVHEFGHSFVNPAVDKVSNEIIKSKEYLFEPIKIKMSDQGYSQWKFSLYEHFVRANEVIIAKLLGDKTEANKILKDNIDNRSFILLPQIVEKLEFWYYNEYLNMSYDEKVNEIIAEMK
ncbi:DUF4932 domain-containing protein [Tenacibaculum aiptasiae]|uniref:DUF4932 domain-containing protein n=1 Tax=Tenacibaculum aiptasiae TaxID=426481 RepID=A0A7J5A8E1_9FLAO|nr:DUF4932 domain-containing protein [Tenacibaculum aiptasiae]KAB1153399.1 DUF4932 domain-containing protein [Tenacibaculum aiptasiae]